MKKETKKKENVIKGWKKYSSHFLEKGSDCFWQKLMTGIGEEKIFADITQWTFDGKKSFDLQIQIPESISITGMTMNINNFSYKKLDFNIIENHAIKIIKILNKES